MTTSRTTEALGNSQFPTPKVIGTKNLLKTYTDRFAVRVVAFDATGHVAILSAQHDNYYKLPGGGIEAGKDHAAAAHREFAEGTGGVIELRDSGCVATTIEFRGHLRQVSYSCCADLVDGSGEPSLTEEEIEDGLEHMWVSVGEAKRLMAEAEPTSEFGKSVRERDMYLLNEATREK